MIPTRLRHTWHYGKAAKHGDACRKEGGLEHYEMLSVQQEDLKNEKCGCLGLGATDVTMRASQNRKVCGGFEMWTFPNSSTTM